VAPPSLGNPGLVVLKKYVNIITVGPGFKEVPRDWENEFIIWGGSL